MGRECQFRKIKIVYGGGWWQWLYHFTVCSKMVKLVNLTTMKLFTTIKNIDAVCGGSCL
jgi:hypothetical protein